MKRRRARERDAEDARERADRRRDELLARLRGEQPAPAERVEPTEEVTPAATEPPDVPETEAKA